MECQNSGPDFSESKYLIVGMLSMDCSIVGIPARFPGFQVQIPIFDFGLSVIGLEENNLESWNSRFIS